MRQLLTFIFINLLSFNLLAQDFSPEGQLIVDSLKQVAFDENSEDTLRAGAFLNLAGWHYQSNSDTALFFCHEAETLAERANWSEGRIEAYGWLGYLYNYAKGDLEKAIMYNDKSMEIARAEGDMTAVATLLNNNSVIYSTWGKHKKAMDCHMEALQIHESSGNKQEYARTLNSIAMLMKNQGFIEKALEIYDVSLQMRREVGEKADIGETLNNIGVIYVIQGDHEGALELYRESLELRREAGNPSEVANSLNNIGNVLSNMGQFDSALVYLFQSLELREEHGLAPGICESSIDIGFAYHKKGLLKEAKEYSLRGYEMAVDFGNVRLIKNSSNTLYRLYAEEGNKAEAFDYYFTHITMRDSMMNSETQRETVQLEAQYSYDKQKAIDDANREKEKALSEEIQKRQRLMIIAGGVGLLLVVGFLIFVFNRLRLTKKQKSVIEQQKLEVESAHEILEEKNTEILDSIAYAKRIQSAILPPDELMQELLPKSFVLYLPKDIVAGDFYWLEQKGDKVLFAAADCTGHGVPGAMVSVICNNGLNRSVREHGIVEPGKILDKTREIIISEFEKSKEEVKDGMDIALVSLDKNNSSLQFAGAHNPLWLIRNNELIELKADKQPVGKFDKLTPYTTQNLKLETGDVFYIFSDGYADQFGGEKGKKMKSKGLKELLLSIHLKELDEQQEILRSHFEEWKGELEQLDDVCIIGVRV